MLTRAELKRISSLNRKKNRVEFGQFVVEGEKMVKEILSSPAESQLITLFHTERASVDHPKAELIAAKDMDRMSMLSSSSDYLALMAIPRSEPNQVLRNDSLVLVLDDVKDPGNLGTIVRMADWFGVRRIYCSKGTVDIYNPKTVQSTMGSMFRVEVVYCDLDELVEEFKQSRPAEPICVAVMDGESVYDKPIDNRAMLIMGSESFGVSQALIEKSDRKVTIPNFGGAESLNVAIATSIMLSEYSRTNLRSGRIGESS